MKKNSAFSLLELAIVVMIIGILIAGVTQSSRMVKEARLKTAQSLTQSSPVNTIYGLLLWYETSLESSFVTSESYDGATISTWYDNSPQSPSKNNATQSTSGYRPKFYEDVFNNGIPGIRFDGTDDYMSFSGSSMLNSSYSILIVERKRASVGSNGAYFLGSSYAGNFNDVLHFGYLADNMIILNDSTENNLILLNSSFFSYSSPIIKIHTGIFDSSTGYKTYWYNGGNSADLTVTASGSLTSYPSPTLASGRGPGGGLSYYNGDLAEIIIFNRALETDERRAIETYLSKKYGVKLS